MIYLISLINNGLQSLYIKLYNLDIKDYILISQSLNNRICEYAQHLQMHFIERAIHKNGKYLPLLYPGYCRMKWKFIQDYSYPNDTTWKQG